MDLQAFHPSEALTGQIASHVEAILEIIGENSQREGLQRTPQRVGEAFQFLTKGYRENPKEILQSALFRADCKQMVIVKDIEFYSLCEHHLMPFFGKVHVAYLPYGHITGLSKIARVVETYARRLQVQEQLTSEICHCIQDGLNARGVMVVIEAQHLCMEMRGVQKPGTLTVTSHFTGDFSDKDQRDYFLRLIGK